MGRALVMREVRLRGASSSDESIGDMMGLGKSPAGKSMCLLVPDFVDLRHTVDGACKYGKHRENFG